MSGLRVVGGGIDMLIKSFYYIQVVIVVFVLAAVIITSYVGGKR